MYKASRLAWAYVFVNMNMLTTVCLVRAPLTVPGHSGKAAIEAKLREGREGTDRGGLGGCGRDIPSWTVTSLQRGQEVGELRG